MFTTSTNHPLLNSITINNALCLLCIQHMDLLEEVLLSKLWVWTFDTGLKWGVVPHCKFGDKIVRGYFDSTVRIVCESPPNEDAVIGISFEVSLNGFDWTNTGF